MSRRGKDAQRLVGIFLAKSSSRRVLMRFAGPGMTKGHAVAHRFAHWVPKGGRQEEKR